MSELSVAKEVMGSTKEMHEGLMVLSMPVTGEYSHESESAFCHLLQTQPAAYRVQQHNCQILICQDKLRMAGE